MAEGKDIIERADTVESQVRELHDALYEQRKELVEKRDQIDQEIREIDSRLERFDLFLNPPETGERQEVKEEVDDDTGRQRKSGVLPLTKEVVTRLPHRDAGWSEDDIVEAVQEQDPGMKDSSIRSALRRLHKQGFLERWGKRGDRRYAIAGEQEKANKTLDNNEPDPSQRAYTIIVNAGEEGAAWSDIAWELGDAEVAEVALHALKETGAIEQIHTSAGITVYRLASETTRAAIAGLQEGMANQAEKDEQENQQEEPPNEPQRRLAFPGVQPPEQ